MGEVPQNFFMASMEEAFFCPMRKALLLSAVVTLSVMTAVMPVQAQETITITTKSFEEKKESKLNKAESKLKKEEAKLEKAQARVNCIKAAKEMNALKKCS